MTITDIENTKPHFDSVWRRKEVGCELIKICAAVSVLLDVVIDDSNPDLYSESEIDEYSSSLVITKTRDIFGNAFIDMSKLFEKCCGIDSKKFKSMVREKENGDYEWIKDILMEVVSRQHEVERKLRKERRLAAMPPVTEGLDIVKKALGFT